MSDSHRIAYITRHVYPDQTAAAGQSIQMAAAFSRLAGKADFYVHEIRVPEASLRAQYPGVADSPLQIRDLRMTQLPKRLLYRHGMSRFIGYNSLVALHLLGRNPRGGSSPPTNILFVRSRLEGLYWGVMRQYLPWLKRWIFIYEVHELRHPEVEASLATGQIGPKDTREGSWRRRNLQHLGNFDLILGISQRVDDDLRQKSEGKLRPRVVRHASGIPRILQPPPPPALSDRVVLGYIGTIDQVRGVDSLITAMRLLPENYVLRLVGRVPGRSDNGHGPSWLDKLLGDPYVGSRVELIPPVPSTQVAEEIDRCDVVLQPCSDDPISLYYRSPLKLFDYMARGKPIVAADVPCHRELCQDGVNALLYRHGDMQHLAARVKSLVERPEQAAVIARRAWELAAGNTYDARAEHILGLVDELWQNKWKVKCGVAQVK